MSKLCSHGMGTCLAMPGGHGVRVEGARLFTRMPRNLLRNVNQSDDVRIKGEAVVGRGKDLRGRILRAVGRPSLGSLQGEGRTWVISFLPPRRHFT